MKLLQVFGALMLLLLGACAPHDPTTPYEEVMQEYASATLVPDSKAVGLLVRADGHVGYAFDSSPAAVQRRLIDSCYLPRGHGDEGCHAYEPALSVPGGAVAALYCGSRPVYQQQPTDATVVQVTTVSNPLRALDAAIAEMQQQRAGRPAPEACVGSMLGSGVLRLNIAVAPEQVSPPLQVAGL